MATLFAAGPLGCRADDDPAERVPPTPTSDSAGTPSIWQPLAEPPAGFPAIEVSGTWRHPLLLSLFEREGVSFAALLDEEARVVWARSPLEPEGRMLRVRSIDDGVIWAEGHRFREVEFGTIGRQTWDEPEPELTRAPYVHHDLIERDGGYLYLGHAFTEIEALGTLPEAVVAQDVLAWVPRGATADDEVQTRFRVDDHLELSAPCGHVAFDVWTPDAWDWTHTNSLVEDGDDLWLMVRYHDTMWRLDADYQLVERVGGVDGDPLAPGERPFTHSHISQVHDGKLVVLDNRNHDGPSRAMALARGPDGWSTAWEIPHDSTVIALGDTQELDDGSVVVAWGTEGRVDAFDADRNWEGSLAFPGFTVGRVEIVDLPSWAR